MRSDHQEAVDEVTDRVDALEGLRLLPIYTCGQDLVPVNHQGHVRPYDRLNPGSILGSILLQCGGSVLVNHGLSSPLDLSEDCLVELLFLFGLLLSRSLAQKREFFLVDGYLVIKLGCLLRKSLFFLL